MFALQSYVHRSVPVGIQHGAVLADVPPVAANAVPLPGPGVGLACIDRRNCFHRLSGGLCLLPHELMELGQGYLRESPVVGLALEPGLRLGGFLLDVLQALHHDDVRLGGLHKGLRSPPAYVVGHVMFFG